MRFAVNFSRQAAALAAAGRIHIDLYKCPDLREFYDVARTHGPTYVHFSLMAGRGRPTFAALQAIHGFLADSPTPHVSSHLLPHAGLLGGMPLDTIDPADDKRVLETILADIPPLIEVFGASKIVLENAPWDPPYMVPRPALTAEMIREVVYRNQCGFLLDLAHASITARHLQVDPYEYIAGLPVDRLAELHISGTQRQPNGEWLDHFPLSEEDWKLTAWALQRVACGDWPRPRIIAFEYGGIGPGYEERTDEHVLQEQTPRLRDMIH